MRNTFPPACCIGRVLSLIHILKESGTVTLIGEATGGDTGNGPRPFCTKQRIYFRIPTRQPDVSSKGFPMEGIGIPPHHQEMCIRDRTEGVCGGYRTT